MDWVTLVSHSNYLKLHLFLHKIIILLVTLVHTHKIMGETKNFQKLIYGNVYYNRKYYADFK